MRRAFLWVMIASVVVLPVWVLVGRGLFGAPLGSGLLVQALVAPLLAIGIAVVAGLTMARKEVRGPRVVTWHDVRVVGPWLLAIVALGMLVVDEAGGVEGSALTALVGPDALMASTSIAALLTFAIVIAGIVIAIVQLRLLLRETRARVSSFLEEAAGRPIVAQDAIFERVERRAPGQPSGPQAGTTIRIEPGEPR